MEAYLQLNDQVTEQIKLQSKSERNQQSEGFSKVRFIRVCKGWMLRQFKLHIYAFTGQRAAGKTGRERYL